MSRPAREIRLALYPLKRKRGEPVQIHQIENNDVNLESGAIDKSYQTFRIKKAIVLPVDYTRSFVYEFLISLFF